MARKSRRRGNRPRPRPAVQQQQAATRPEADPGSPGGDTATAAVQRPAPQQRVGGDQALVRAVEMSLAPPAPGRRQGRGVIIETGDPAIPLDRVPYFTTDLIRVAVTGAAMIALLVVASLLIIPRLVS